MRSRGPACLQCIPHPPRPARRIAAFVSVHPGAAQPAAGPGRSALPAARPEHRRVFGARPRRALARRWPDSPRAPDAGLPTDPRLSRRLMRCSPERPQARPVIHQSCPWCLTAHSNLCFFSAPRSPLSPARIAVQAALTPAPAARAAPNARCNGRRSGARMQSAWPAPGFCGGVVARASSSRLHLHPSPPGIPPESQLTTVRPSAITPVIPRGVARVLSGAPLWGQGCGKCRTVKPSCPERQCAESGLPPSSSQRCQLGRGHILKDTAPENATVPKPRPFAESRSAIGGCKTDCRRAHAPCSNPRRQELVRFADRCLLLLI